jgi:hypothetical protein
LILVVVRRTDFIVEERPLGDLRRECDSAIPAVANRLLHQKDLNYCSWIDRTSKALLPINTVPFMSNICRFSYSIDPI